MRSECDNGHTEKSWKKNMNILVAFSRTFARFSPPPTYGFKNKLLLYF